MNIYKDILETRSKVVDVICNKCGGSLKSHYGNLYGIPSVIIETGYGCKLGDDGDFYFSLCEDCVFELIQGFKIAPERL